MAPTGMVVVHWGVEVDGGERKGVDGRVLMPPFALHFKFVKVPPHGILLN